MYPTLLESNRTFFRSAECAFASIAAHAVLAIFAFGLTAGGRQLPSDEREARVFFLLPPDRVDIRVRQTETIQWGKLGGDLQDGMNLTAPGVGKSFRAQSYGARGPNRGSGARGELPFGPMPSLVPDTVFSVLEVDEEVRYENSSAPVYPRELLAVGAEGLVQTIYVVDTTGRVDTASIKVVSSDDPRFTESVRSALGGMRFRPAKRDGKLVRQMVEQKFRFRIMPPSQVAEQVS